MRFYFKKIGMAQVFVTLKVAGVNRRGFNPCFDLCSCKVFAFGLYFGPEAVKPAGDIGDHQVFDLKTDFAVRGVDDPFCVSHIKCLSVFFLTTQNYLPLLTKG